MSQHLYRELSAAQTKSNNQAMKSQDAKSYAKLMKQIILVSLDIKKFMTASINNVPATLTSQDVDHVSLKLYCRMYRFLANQFEEITSMPVLPLTAFREARKKIWLKDQRALWQDLLIQANGARCHHHLVPLGHTFTTWRNFNFLTQEGTSSNASGHTQKSNSQMICGQDSHRLQPQEQIRQLYHVIQELRHTEETWTFHRQLQLDQKQLLKQEYSADNFSYGSTPYSSWKELWNTSSYLRNVLLGNDSNKKQDSSLEIAIFGSSTGWLGFYTALALFPSSIVRITGYEILPSLVAAAQRIQRQYCPESIIHSSSRLEFRCQDMLQADLRNTRVAVLTSQCWDAPLVCQVYQKLVNELPTEALVIDYAQHVDCPKASLTLVDTVIVPVSWNARQQFYIYLQKGDRMSI